MRRKREKKEADKVNRKRNQEETRAHYEQEKLARKQTIQKVKAKLKSDREQFIAKKRE